MGLTFQDVLTGYSEEKIIHTYWDLKLTFLLILPMPYFKWYNVKVQVNICFFFSQSFEGFLSRLLFSTVYCAKQKLSRFMAAFLCPGGGSFRYLMSFEGNFLNNHLVNGLTL